MLSSALPASILTPGHLPGLSFSISMSHNSPVTVSPGTSFPPSSVPGNNHSQNKDMLTNTFFFQRPIQHSSSHVLRCGLESLYQHGREGKWHAGVFYLVAAVWRGFILLFPFTLEESSPPSTPGVTPRAADACHIQHPQRRKSPGALTCARGLILVFNTVSSCWG